MLGALKVYARAGQGTIVTPFILAGAMSPVTVAGTLAQVLAEVLAGAALTQLCRPGAPVVFGCFAASISMQSGAPTFGTPEPSLVSYGAAQLARRLGIPFRTGGGLCASKVADAQAAYESANTLNTTLLAGTNFVLHAAGWLEGGLASGYEKFVMDCDQLAMLQRFAEGVDLSENGQALSAIREVGPGSHYLGCRTRRPISRRPSTAPPSPTTIPSSNGWRKARRPPSSAPTRSGRSGSPTTRRRRSTPGIDEALKDFIARKKASMPDAFA